MKSERLYLDHIRECIANIEEFVSGGRADFDASIKTQSAVLHMLQVMAESTLRLPDERKAAYPEVGWQHIRNFRNRLVHDYLSVDLEIVWEVVEKSLPPLKQAVEMMLANLEPDNNA